MLPLPTEAEPKAKSEEVVLWRALQFVARETLHLGNREERQLERQKLSTAERVARSRRVSAEDEITAGDSKKTDRATGGARMASEVRDRPRLTRPGSKLLLGDFGCDDHSICIGMAPQTLSQRQDGSSGSPEDGNNRLYEPSSRFMQQRLAQSLARTRRKADQIVLFAARSCEADAAS